MIEQTQRDDKTYTKRYVNGIGTDEVLGYENESLGMNEAEYRENLFCKNTVLPNQTDFEAFGYTGILNRCAELGAIANNSEITKNVYYFGKDHLGNIVSLTNETGKLLLKYEYDAFGKVYVKTGSGFIEIDKYQGNLYENTRLFTGREFDKEIGLYYYRARYYSADLGRFISRDPIGQNDDVNLYAYVGNNSVMFVDPSGEIKALVVGVTEFGLEMSGLQDIGEAQGAMIAYWVGYASNDPYLMKAGEQGIYDESMDVVEQLNPGKKLKTIDKFYSKTKKTTKTVENAVEKKVPNPYGKNGGPAHQAKIQEIVDKVNAGDGKVKTEKMINIENGHKSKRYIDVFDEINKKGYQIGKKNKNGTPVSREKKAIEDLQSQGYDIEFIPYN